MTENLSLFDPAELPPESLDVLESQIRQVFSAWQDIMGYPSRQLTTKRRTLIRGRLKHFSVEQLIQALQVAASDPFWRGQNDRNTPFDDILNLFRNDERVEGFISRSSTILKMLPSKDYTTKDF